MSKRQPTRLEILVMEPQIVLLYESGMTIKDLIPIVKLGRRSILSVLKKHGIEVKNRAPRKPPLKRVVVTIPLESHKLLSDFAESQGLFLLEAAEVLIRAGFNALNPELPQNGNAAPCTTLHSELFVLERVHREAQLNPSNESLKQQIKDYEERKDSMLFKAPSNESLRGKDGKILLRDDLPIANDPLKSKRDEWIRGMNACKWPSRDEES